LNYVQGLGKVDNYKVILKSVNQIQQMLKGKYSSIFRSSANNDR